jgi:hypothetical protein
MTKMNVRSRNLIARLRNAGWCWQTAGAVFGLFFGILSPLIGSAFTAISWVSGPQWHGFSVQRYGTVLLCLTIPLLLLGAHCLDLLDKRDSEAAETKETVRREEDLALQSENISEDHRIEMAVAQETVLRLLR